MKQAVHFGAGSIGRGFLGQLYSESGYALTFVDVDETVIDAIRARGAYDIHVVGDAPGVIQVSHVRALHASATAAVAEALAKADIASTAAGVRALEHIAPLLAAGIARRLAESSSRPLDIIVCENLLHAGPHLRALVRPFIEVSLQDAFDKRIGFVEASVGRMVPLPSPEQRAEDPLRVYVEAFCTLPVDAAAFRGPIPKIRNLEPHEDFGAYVERKLFVHNMSHAATAYFGHLHGHEFIWQAIADLRIHAAVEHAMDEACAGLHAKHGLAMENLAAHRDDLLERFANRALGDRIARVAADPLRKLGPEDRLIGAMRLCVEHHQPSDAIALAAAAAIRYDNANDPGAATLRQILDTKGLDGVLRDVCHVDPAGPVGHRITEASLRLAREGWLGH